ncbi:MAG: DegV family protein [Clostridiales bacterium]|nr:DegV family protein [Clostridiales bacterium]
MGTFSIITDSTSDLSLDLREKYGIDYCKMEFSEGEKNYHASLDWDEISYKDFYGSMRQGKRYKTVQVPVKTFDEKFREHLEKGNDILYIACSSGLSGSINTAKVLSEELRSAYPGRKIICIDSLISGLGQGSMAIKAAEMKQEGKSLEETAAWIEENKLFFNQYGTVESLDYLKAAGRVTASSAFFGNLFAVKPILISDLEGHNLAVKKVKGRKSSLEELAIMTAKYIENPADQTIYIGHADDEAAATAASDKIKELIPGAKTSLYVIGPIVGASVGPGTVIVFYYGKNKKEQLDGN